MRARGAQTDTASTPEPQAPRLSRKAQRKANREARASAATDVPTIPEPPRAATGRPSKFTPALADEIVTRMSSGQTLTSICKDAHMPSVTSVARWLGAEGEAFDVFRGRYRRARTECADRLADQVIDIADSASDVDTASAARVQVAARQWLASKMAPRTYGDNVNVALGAAEGGIVINLGRFVAPESKPLALEDQSSE